MRGGVGDRLRNDGVMVLILRDDGFLRVELGAGYGRNWDRIAQEIVDDVFLPPMRRDVFGTAIIAGSAP